MKRSRRGHKTICMRFDSQEHYEACVRDNETFRQHIESEYGQHPELFPPEMGSGFSFHDSRISAKLKLKTRRILMSASGEAYQIRASFVMPYNVALTEDVEKGLFFRQWGVSFDALAYGFGGNAMFWYRMTVSVGRASIVGTTVKSPEVLPKHIVADEKHTQLKDEKAYVATTAAHNVFLGAEVTTSASSVALKKGYGEFAQEAANVDPEYLPETVCVDPWDATRKAFETLFPNAAIILCFLHSILKVGKCKGKGALRQLRAKVAGRAWYVYKAPTKVAFSQRMRRLREWAVANLPVGQLLDAVNAMSAKRSSFTLAYDFDSPHRTTNGVDRLMDHMDRVLYAMRYLHGDLHSASLAMRSMALIWNFHPYGLRARPNAGRTASPFSELNGFCYHDNWLQNLLIASSMGGWRTSTTAKHRD